MPQIQMINERKGEETNMWEVNIGEQTARKQNPNFPQDQ